MDVRKSITINKPINEVWNLLAENFDKAQDWMSAIPRSDRKHSGNAADNAPMIGRICELSTRPNGPIADETITLFDREKYRLGINVIPRNGKIPVEQNNAIYQLKALGDNETSVEMTSDIQLKTAGKVLYPVLKAGVGKSFAEQLEELKYYLENGKPHPRKKH